MAARGAVSGWAVGVLWCAGLFACTAPETLEVGPIGCLEVRRGGLCVLPAQARQLKLLVVTEPGAELAVSAHGQALPLSCQEELEPTSSCRARAGGSVIQVPLAGVPMALSLSVSRGRFASRRYELRIEPPAPLPAFLQTAQKLWTQDNRPKDAEALLQKNLQRADLPLTERAAAQGDLAQILYEQLRIKEAEQTFRAAILLDEQAGLVSQKSGHMFQLADLLQDQRQLLKLEPLLRELRALSIEVASDRPWPALYQAQAEQARGNLDQALRQLDEADRWNALCGDPKSIHMAAVLRTQVQSDLGQVREDAYIRKATEQLSQPCALGLLLRRQAQMRIQVLESELGAGAAPDKKPDKKIEQRLLDLWRRWEADQPAADASPILVRHDRAVQELLQRSLAVLLGSGSASAQSAADSCPIPRHIALVLLTQARLALLGGRLEDARALLDEVQTRLEKEHIEPAQTPAFSVEWNRLTAQLLRAQGRHEEALVYSDRLKSYAGEDVSSHEIRWLQQVERAQALAALGASRRAEAVTALREADQILEEAGRSAPTLLQRGPLLGRFEWGTRLLLELLLRVDDSGLVLADQGERAAALSLVRHVRTRSLLELRRLDRLQQLDDAGRRRFEAAVKSYLELRAELDRAASVLSPPEQLTSLREQARQQLERALSVLEQEEAVQQRSPSSGEVMLSCHPLHKRWACMAAEPGYIAAWTLSADEMGDPLAMAPLAQKLLGPAQELLRRARTLSVLGYGAMREVPVHLLPFDGQPLGQRLQVSYSLDLGPAPLPKASRLAVVATDSTLERAGMDSEPGAASEPISAALAHEARWDTVLYDLGTHGSVAGRAQSAPRLTLHARIASAGLLLLFGHADYTPASGWSSGLAWSPWNRLTAGDVLVLPSVPQKVVLIACNSGNGADPVGGQESLGLAQAFLLKQSQEVLGTTRAVHASTGVLVAERLAAQLAAVPGDTLAHALQVTLGALSAPSSSSQDDKSEGTNEPGRRTAELLAREQLAAELDAFRVFTR